MNEYKLSDSKNDKQPVDFEGILFEEKEYEEPIKLDMKEEPVEATMKVSGDGFSKEEEKKEGFATRAFKLFATKRQQTVDKVRNAKSSFRRARSEDYQSGQRATFDSYFEESGKKCPKPNLDRSSTVEQKEASGESKKRIDVVSMGM